MSERYTKLYRSRLSDINQIGKESFDFLITDLMYKDVQGKQKQRELTAHNLEKIVDGQFIPSMFYIFMYAKNNKPDKFGKLEFYDVCPVLFCTSVSETTISGINFNFVPNALRAVLFDIIEDTNIEFYRTVLDTNINTLTLNNNLGMALSTPKGLSDFITFIKSKTNIDLTPCVRTYLRKSILKSRMIEYDEWYRIMFLSFQDSVRGIKLSEIQQSLINKDK